MVKETEIGGPGGAGFPDTPWTAILAKARERGGLDPSVLDRIARLYWRPVYFWFRYRWNRPPDDAKDLTQELFTRLINPESVVALDPQRGRLRLYLKASADNLARQVARDAGRLKRGGGRRLADLDQVDEARFQAPEDDAACERLYDAEWAKALVERSMELLEERLRQARKERYVELLRFHDLAKGETPSYQDAAERFGLTLDQVRNHLRYARGLLREIVREHLKQSLADPTDVDGEYEHLFGSSG